MKSLRTKAYVLLLLLGIAATAVAGARTVLAPSYQTWERNENVVVVGVPSLDWEVITPTTMPHLWQLAEAGATGLSTARAARSVTCPWDGWITLGAGNRARYPAAIPENELPPEPQDPLPGDPAEIPPPTPESSTPEEKRQEAATEGCLGQRGAVPTVNGSKLAPAIEENKGTNFGAVPGALGTAVRCTTVVGGPSILAVGSEEADVRVAESATSAQGWADLVGQCPLTLVATSHALDRSAIELQALDTAIDQVVQGAKARGATVIIAGISQPEYKRARLHAIIASGPGISEQVLSSPSTSRTPYSQLIDIAPTVLSVLGESKPSSMTGQVLRGEARDLGIADQVQQYRSDSVAASAHIWMAGKFFTFLTWLAVVATLALAWGLHRGRGGGGFTRTVGTVVGLLPTASLLANLFPWWLTGRPSVAIIVSIATSWAAVSAFCLLGPWRRYRSGPLIAASAITFGALGIDVLTGSHLQLNSPLGYDAIVAGRFTGFGNITFAMFAAAGLVVLAAACRLSETKAKTTVLIAVIGLAMIALDGAPGAGADFGGVVALVPALFVMWMLITGTRLSRARLILVTLAGALAVMAIAVADYLRPEQNQTHLGRFVGQILDGTAVTIIQRKLAANYRVLTSSILAILAIVLVAVIVWQWLNRRSAGWAYVNERAPYAGAAVVAVAGVSFVGFAVNDSGIAVTAAALAVVVPPMLGILRTGVSSGDDT